MKAVFDKNGKELAVILQAMDYMMGEDKKFFNNSNETLQVGALFFPPKSTVPAHIHKPIASSSMPMEVLLVLCGDPEVEIYDDNKQFIVSIALACGDILIQKSGGHGFKFSSDTRLLEVKRGPYHGKESDKEII
jgi:hypothetical protein